MNLQREKAFCSIMALLLLVAVFGCGESPQPDEKETEITATAVQEDVAPDKATSEDETPVRGISESEEIATEEPGEDDSVETEGLKPTPEIPKTEYMMEYEVRKGDTWESIADKAGLELEELLRFNGAKSGGELKTGKTVDIPVPGRKPATYRVKRGDSLYSIARKHKVSLKQLRFWNGLESESSLIHPGQDLVIYVKAE